MPLTSRVAAFVDEYGDANLDTTKSGVSTFFIVTAVLVDSGRVVATRNAVDAVRVRHFQTGELKSSSVAANDERRLTLLRELAEIPWRFYSVAVDKRQISKTGGLIYKRPFLKFLSGKLYRRLFEVLPVLELVSDQHGTPEFMSGFVKYVERNFKPDLFSRAAFTFTDSSSEVLVQLADFVAGSVARDLDPKKQSSRSPEILQLLRPQAIGIEEWPPRRRSFTVAPAAPATSADDRLVAEQSLMSAVNFIEDHGDDADPDVLMQVEAAKFLVFHYQHVTPERYIAKEALIQAIGQAVNARVTENAFRQKVIAKLRDAGVLIASSSRGGYKIPASVKDLIDFVELAQTIVEPMLHRVEVARQRIRLASNGQIDIVSEPRFADLKKLLETRGAG